MQLRVIKPPFFRPGLRAPAGALLMHPAAADDPRPRPPPRTESIATIDSALRTVPSRRERRRRRD